MRLAETIANWFGHVEIVLSRADGILRDGEEALARGDAMRARQAAKALLERVPQSPIGLALLADACEAAHLDAELAQTLEELALRAASQADVWIRLGRARERVANPPEDVRDAFLRALSVASPGSEARREALLWLADLDLSHGDGARAEMWLERLADRKHADVALRRAEARILQRDAAGAERALEGVETDPTDGRAALLRGRALAARNDAGAFTYLIRAAVLDAPSASEALATALARIPTDEATRTRIHTVVDGRGEGDLVRWRAAFARAEGRRDEARAALVAAVRAGEASARRPLLDMAIEDRDAVALSTALGAGLEEDAVVRDARRLPPLARAKDPARRPLLDMAIEDRDAVALSAALGAGLDEDAVVRDARRLPPLARAKDPGETAAILDATSAIETDAVRPWADDLRRVALETWIPPSGAPSRWTDLLTRLDAHARAQGALGERARIAELAVERSRPVRVAIVGEFNAGKSTFINAVIGADVAPTGILPTTATLHHLRYAPDAFARIRFLEEDPASGTRERIVATTDLRAALATTDIGNVERVEILVPMASLTRVEILDTPGFNAPDVRHTAAARNALDRADFAIWLLDATQALKQTERLVLEEAKARDLPVQILVNKADRLKPDELAQVMANVEASLRESGLRSWSPPLPLSARLALQAKVGDEATRAESEAKSGWDAVQRLLDEQIVGRSEELKERGLRRRAALVTATLTDRVREEATRERAHIDAARERAHALAQRAGNVERESDEIAQVITGALGPSTTAWRRDIDVLAVGRDRAQAERDPMVVRYKVDRAVAHLAPPLARVLASLASPESAPLEGAAESDWRALAQALVRTFTLAGGTGTELRPLAESAVASLADRLLELAVAPPDRGRAEGRAAELEAIGQALAPAAQPEKA